jgi:tetratricopeptide (TPR) repeat protein
MPVILLLTLLALQAVPPEALPHIQAGVDAQNQGRINDAIAEFRKVAVLAPDLPAAFVSLGSAYMRAGDYEAAVAPLKRALQLDASLVGAQQLLGFALLSAGYAAESMPYLEKVGARDALGLAQLKAGELPEAVASLQTALAKRPGDPDLLYYLGRAAGLLSRQAFDTLHASQPDSARAHQVLGETFAVLKNMAGAEREYREALRLKPATPGVHLELGELYAAGSEWDKAEAEFLAERNLQPGDAEAAYRLGDALLQQGRVKEARAELERARRLGPGMAEILYELGKAAALEGDKAAAEQAWSGVIAAGNEGPLAAQAHFGLANLYRRQGKSAQAEFEMREFQRLQTAK